MSAPDPIPDDLFSTPASGASSFDIGRLLGLARKFFWIPLVTMGVGGGIAFVYGKTLKPTYISNAEIKVERRASGSAGRDETVTTPEDIKTIEQSFLSPMLMARVVGKLNLTAKDNFLAPNRPASKVTEGELVGYLLQHSSISIVPDTRLIRVTFEHWEPIMTQEVTRALVDQGIDLDREQRVGALGTSITYLKNEAAKLETSLKNSREKLNAYTRETGNISIVSADLDVVAQQLRDMSARLGDVKAARLKIESDYEQILTCLNDEDKLLAIESIRKVPAVDRLYIRAGELRNQLSKLAQRYGPVNPLMIQTETEYKLVQENLKNEVLNAPKSVEVALATARRNEESLIREQTEQEQKVMKTRELKIEADALEGQIKADQIAYEENLRRLNETEAQARSQPVLLQIIEPAGPAYSNPVKSMKILASGVAAGLFLGLGVIFLLMQLDTSFSSTKDAENLLNLTAMASVPEYKPKTAMGATEGKEGKGASTPPNLSRSPVVSDRFSPVAEAFRTLRASIQIADESGPYNSILVTSAVSGEGKSFSCLNLAAALANSGLRVLLVDADLRKPVLEERIFSTRGNLGLADYLRGAASFASVIRSTLVPNLDAVSAGSISPDLSDALSAPRLHEFLQEAEPNYDHIIVDSAALSTVTDTLSFARLFRTVFLVIRESKTPRAVVQRAVELLNRAGAKPTGFIMNFSSAPPVEDELFIQEATEQLDFPKSCPGCGRVYESFDDYFRRTTPPKEEASPDTSEAQRSMHFSRLCECGTPVIVAADSRRDLTEEGLRRRQLFADLLGRLIDSGQPRVEARAKLLLILKLWRNEIAKEGASGVSKASARRRELFDQLLGDLIKSGLSKEEAKAKLLQTIEVWRAAP